MRAPAAKLAHLEACLLPESQYTKTTGLEHVVLNNQAGCDIAFQDISLETCFFGHKLKAPLMIAPMTGGVEKGRLLNERWAKAAEHFGIAMGVGSQRVALENPELAATFEVRKHAPNAFLMSNLGAAQIARGMPLEQIQRAVDMIRADAIMIHFNAMQEACQGGDVDYRNLNANMSKVCEYFAKQNLPVIAREVCFGLTPEATQRFINMGVTAIDCAGAGGTSWSKVEALCAKTERQKNLAMRFGEWGIPTADSIQNVRSVSKKIPLIATGGIRSGQDVVKALKLGANLGAMARPMLIAANESEEALFEFIEDLLTEIRITLFAHQLRGPV